MNMRWPSWKIRRTDREDGFTLIEVIISAQASGGQAQAATPSSSLGVALASAAGCLAAPGTPVVRFAWTDLSTGATHVAVYSTQPVTNTPSASRLIRTECVTPSGGSTTIRRASRSTVT